MSFIKECIEDSLPIWEECLNSEFLRRMADGSLPEECFKGYIIDDSLYLREYSKVFAWGILHAKDMAQIRNYYSLLSFVSEAEDATRLHYLKRYHLTDEEIQPLPLRPENQAYVDTMLTAAHEGGRAAECMMAALPCMLSYAWIFPEMLRRSPQVLDTVYGKLAGDYIGENYQIACQEWIDFAEKVCESLTQEERKSCMSIFRACSLHELHFWEMSGRPRTDAAL